MQPIPTAHGQLDLTGSPLVMGILNVTPDSFSDGGQFVDAGRAVAHAQRMADAGADLIDVGGESTRPGSASVDAAEQLRRVVPVVVRLRGGGFTLPISVDTRLAAVARAALDAGADLVNDISALRDDPAMATLLAERGVPVVLMHMRGTPATMQDDAHYDDVVAEILTFLADRIAAAVAAGIDRGRIIVDPGIGFGKKSRHNLTILARLREFHTLGQPILIGTSRKMFIGGITGQGDPADRLMGTAATVTAAVLAGAHILRVHDVAEMRQVVATSHAIAGASS